MVTSTGLSRRLFLAAALAATAGQGRAAAPRRLAAIDWAMAETATALGHAPVATAELIAFRRAAPEAPPATTVDLGLRGAPNLEALSLVAPDLILSSSYYAFAEPQLARIAPVFTRSLYVPGEAAFPKLRALLAELAAALDDAPAGARAQAAADAGFAALAARAAAHAGPACLLIDIGDSRHVRILGTDSLFAGALLALGLRNAWAEGTRFAYAAPVPVEQLADFPEARFLIVRPMPVQTERSLARSALWNSLAPVRAGRTHVLPETNPFGGLPSALAFAQGLVAVLEAQA